MKPSYLATAILQFYNLQAGQVSGLIRRLGRSGTSHLNARPEPENYSDSKLFLIFFLRKLPYTRNLLLVFSTGFTSLRFTIYVLYGVNTQAALENP